MPDNPPTFAQIIDPIMERYAYGFYLDLSRPIFGQPAEPPLSFEEWRARSHERAEAYHAAREERRRQMNPARLDRKGLRVRYIFDPHYGCD